MASRFPPPASALNNWRTMVSTVAWRLNSGLNTERASDGKPGRNFSERLQMASQTPTYSELRPDRDPQRFAVGVAIRRSSSKKLKMKTSRSCGRSNEPSSGATATRSPSGCRSNERCPVCGPM